MAHPYPNFKIFPLAFRFWILTPLFLIFSVVLQAQPLVHAFFPTSGPIGTVVTITGSNFGTSTQENMVYFGTAKATVLSGTASSLTVTVPSGAHYQPISVTTHGLIAYSSKPFLVTSPEPHIRFSTTSFESRKDFATDRYPVFITRGDVDGDGNADLAVLNQNDNSISFFRNTGSPGIMSWAPPIQYAAGSNPFSAALGDFNGDGKPDLARGDYEGDRIIIYKNAGNPGTVQFVEKKELAIAQYYNPISIGIADFDIDGKPDIVAVNNNGNSVSVFRNISTPDSIFFAAKKDFAVGNWPHRLTVNDFNGD